MVAGAWTGALAQEAAPNGGETEKPAPPPWSSQCTAPSRDGPLDCVVEQRAVVTETGQLLILVTVRVPAETRKPVMTVRAPLSMLLPAGVTIDVDGQNPVRLDYQTCDNQGCYAFVQISDEMLQTMFKGLKLNVTIENHNKQDLTVPMSLVGFTGVYGGVR
jgi:invasion protein IalB